jgi:glycosyltransferase involved in cell wall biosynthesis
VSTPAVTVVVPGFDVAGFAAEALASLRAQTRTDWTAVLVDDASTDATGALFSEAAAGDPRFRVVSHDRRRGLSAARNTGLALVDTPYLAFLDADDRMRPDALTRWIDALDASGSDFVVGAYVRLRPYAAGTGSTGYVAGAVQPWVAAATDPARAATTLREHPAASGNIVAWSKLSRAAFWTRTGLHFPEGRLYEDQIVAQEMYTRARAFDVIPDVVVEWRERADGSSITQHKDALPVLHEYLAAMRGGIDVLADADQPAAVAERVRLIVGMDLPPLVAIAEQHPDAGYRRALGAFGRDLVAMGADAATPDLATALRW